MLSIPLLVSTAEFAPFYSQHRYSEFAEGLNKLFTIILLLSSLRFFLAVVNSILGSFRAINGRLMRFSTYRRTFNENIQDLEKIVGLFPAATFVYLSRFYNRRVNSAILFS